VKGAQSGGGRDEKRDEKRLRVSAELRARIADGIYPVGALLPPQRELARELGVARDTVQRALTHLKRGTVKGAVFNAHRRILR